MITITYTPTRKIVGDGGTIIIDVEKFDSIGGPEFVGKRFKSLDGTVVSSLDRFDEKYSIETVAFDPSELVYWRELAASTINYEEFSINPSGIPGIANGAQDYRMIENTYKETRVSNMFKVSFNVELV